jgi:hypothetical protein
MLTTLREKGKKLFVMTNSHAENCNEIMTATLGKDWQNFFDLSIANALKPNQFTSKERLPFYVCDMSKKDLKGEKIEDGKLLTESNQKIYLNGSWQVLEEHFEESLEKKDLRYLYVGDHISSDCINPS